MRSSSSSSLSSLKSLPYLLLAPWQTSRDPVYAFLNESDLTVKDILTRRWCETKLAELKFIGLTVCFVFLPQAHICHHILVTFPFSFPRPNTLISFQNKTKKFKLTRFFFFWATAIGRPHRLSLDVGFPMDFDPKSAPYSARALVFRVDVQS